ncbi:ORF1112 [White spot syndrome virus]|uniref:ORF1112 n=1 Tax=White spot syndrome virus TaxID=342409 RepID=A0A2D3I753_9VIRU|nr:ORF1112 [White spot syndrome virus]
MHVSKLEHLMCALRIPSIESLTKKMSASSSLQICALKLSSTVIRRKLQCAIWLLSQSTSL